MKEVIDNNNGVVTELHSGDKPGIVIVKSWQDAQGVIEQNRKRYNEFSGKRDKDMHLKAEVPVTVVKQWSKELGDNCLKKKYREFIRRKLNDPDNRYWLTTPGKMGKMSNWR